MLSCFFEKTERHSRAWAAHIIEIFTLHKMLRNSFRASFRIPKYFKYLMTRELLLNRFGSIRGMKSYEDFFTSFLSIDWKKIAVTKKALNRSTAGSPSNINEIAKRSSTSTKTHHLSANTQAINDSPTCYYLENCLHSAGTNFDKKNVQVFRFLTSSSISKCFCWVQNELAMLFFRFCLFWLMECATLGQWMIAPNLF